MLFSYPFPAMAYMCVHEAPTCLISCLKLEMIVVGFLSMVRSWEYQWGARKRDMYGKKRKVQKVPRDSLCHSFIRPGFSL